MEKRAAYWWVEEAAARRPALALEPPAPEAALALAERYLGGPLPPSYRTFLERWNGAALPDGTRLLGVRDAARPESLENDVVRANASDVRYDELAEDLVIFAVRADGSVDCFDASVAPTTISIDMGAFGAGEERSIEARLDAVRDPAAAGELPVVAFDPRRDGTRRTHDSFAEWLRASIRRRERHS